MIDDDSPYALVVDDDALIRMDAAMILEDAGFRTFEAAHVDEAEVILKKSGQDIQLLFTDVQMPPSERTGFDLARLCANGWPHIGIIVASGAVKPEGKDLPPGASFIEKPFSPDVVVTHLQRILPDGAKPEPLKRTACT